MHKRNITLMAMALAAVITGAFFFFPKLTHSGVIDIFYFPSILLTVILSGNGHSPSAIAGWSSFIIYTLSYWIIFEVLYAFLLEVYLFRRALPLLEIAKRSLTSESPDFERALASVGMAISQVELRRRKHFLLRSTDNLDLDPRTDLKLQAIQAIAQAGDKKLVKRVLKKLESKISAEKGPEAARQLMDKLHQQAMPHASQKPPARKRPGGDFGPSGTSSGVA